MLLSPLRERDFRIYWAGQAVSRIGTWMQEVLVALLVVELTTTKTQIATYSFVAACPAIAFSLVGGRIGDTIDRRRFVMFAQVPLAIIAMVFAALIAAHRVTMPTIYALELTAATIVAVVAPAAMAIVPSLVPPQKISAAVAWDRVTFHGAIFVAPALAAVVSALVTRWVVFAANGASYFVVAGSLLLVRTQIRPKGPAEGGAKTVLEGLGYVVSNAIPRTAVALTGLTALLVAPFMLVFMAVANHTLFHGTDGSYGAIMSAAGCGGLVGALAQLRIRHGALFTVLLVCAPVTATLLGVLSFVDRVALVVPIMFVMSAARSFIITLSMTAIQNVVPDALRARVSSVQFLAIMAGVPLGGVLIGVLADHLGLRVLMRASAITYAAICIPLLLYPDAFRTPWRRWVAERQES